NTRWAQGGISAVFDGEDTLGSHAEDTLRVGAGLCHRDMVERAVSMAPQLVERLAREYGVRFDRENGDEDSQYRLGREGGHSHRRIVHYLDSTGAEMMRGLLQAAEAHPNITILPHHMVIDLLSWSKVDGTSGCFGVYSLDSSTGSVGAYVAPVTVLATGGAGK